MAIEDVPEPEFERAHIAELTAAQIQDIDSIDVSAILAHPATRFVDQPLISEEEYLHRESLKQANTHTPKTEGYQRHEPPREPQPHGLPETWTGTLFTRYEKITGSIGAAAMVLAVNAEAITHDKSKLGLLAALVGAGSLTLTAFSWWSRDHGSR